MVGHKKPIRNQMLYTYNYVCKQPINYRYSTKSTKILFMHYSAFKCTLVKILHNKTQKIWRKILKTRKNKQIKFQNFINAITQNQPMVKVKHKKTRYKEKK